MGDSDGFILKFLAESRTQGQYQASRVRASNSREKKSGEKGLARGCFFLWLIPKAVRGGSCSHSSAGHAESCGHAALALLIET